MQLMVKCHKTFDLIFQKLLNPFKIYVDFDAWWNIVLKPPKDQKMVIWLLFYIDLL
jgi:hypothetical protein